MYKETFDIEKLKKKIDSVKIVSFDIFDTLLLRPYIQPTDVFRHLEKIYGVDGFFDERVKAEKKAREASTREEITFAEIYNQINNDFLLMKDKELELEYQVLQPNVEIKKLFEYALSLKKKIIISSDMYLDKDCIERILNKNGYYGYEKIYLSSDIKKTKSSGSLYKFICDDLTVKASDILHIGDNFYSDVKKATEQGLNAEYYPKVADRLFNISGKFKQFYNNGALEISILLGVLAIYNVCNRESFWEKLGYFYGGVSCYAYIDWIINQLKTLNVTDLIFVARDGYSLKKVYDLLADSSKIKSHYIYAPRKVNLICTLQHQNDLGKLIYIFEFYKHKYNILQDYCKPFDDLELALEYFKKNESVLKIYSNKELNEYRKYLLSFKLNISCCVDTFSFNFSAQKLLELGLSDKLLGLYWQASVDSNEDFRAFFVKDSKKYVYFKEWNFMEFIMTAPELPIEYISNGRVVYKNNVSNHEEFRKKIYPLVSNGIVQFVKDIKFIFGNYNINFSNNLVRLWINLLADCPTQEEKYFLSKVYHASGFNHDKYIHLFSWWYSKNYIEKKIYLLGFVPFISIRKWDHKIKYYIFKIPLLKKRIYNNKIKFYLLDFICLLKIRN